MFETKNDDGFDKPGVEKSTVAPWFDKPGSGTQFKLPMTIRDLIYEGYIAPK